VAGGVITGVVVLLSAGSVAFVLTRHGDTATASSSLGNRPGAEVATGDRAAAWVAEQVSRSVTVSCDPVMCQALRAHGVPSASLLELNRGADPLRSGVIVATPAVRHLLGSRLGSVYAPAALASFGSGSGAISVRPMAPHGAAAYSSAFAADVRARKGADSELLHSQRITVSATARWQLADGLVDSRLLVTIATLAAGRPVSIVGFGDLAPGASPGVPMRSADLAESGVTGPNRAAYLRSVLRLLRAQRGGYMAARIQNVPLPGGGELLRIEFAAPSPLGLLSPRAG